MKHKAITADGRELSKEEQLDLFYRLQREQGWSVTRSAEEAGIERSRALDLVAKFIKTHGHGPWHRLGIEPQRPPCKLCGEE